ncbi:MAG: hypothetical protein GXY55_07575 [Phycisphaerae bacterium]|nr:hypothetical protein [Phycisphaerae bacterium]
MPSKRMLIAALVLLNVVLLTAVLLSSYTPPAAIAQMAEDNEEMAPAPASPGPETVLIAVQADASNDVIYLFDSRNMILHAFRTPFPRMAGQPVDVTYAGWRDLSREFQRQEGRTR